MASAELSEVESLARELQAASRDSLVFHADMEADLGLASFRRLVDLSQRGLRRAHEAVAAHLHHKELAPGGVRASCAVFDGLRLARLGLSLTLAEASEATFLTAAGFGALRELSAQAEAFVGRAQGIFGAAASLRGAVDTLRSGGLQGIGALAGSLEAAAEIAIGITQDTEDPKAVLLASRMRQLEAEVRPLLGSSGAMESKQWHEIENEVLWETRMVDVSEVVTQALREARAEAGGWAICVDVAEELQRRGRREGGGSARSDGSARGGGCAGCPNEVALDAAKRFEAAGKGLHAEGVRQWGARGLHAAREALAAVCTAESGRAGAQEEQKEEEEESAGDEEKEKVSPEQLLRDAIRWLAESVGAAAVLSEAVEHRVPTACAAAGIDGATVQRHLQAAAASLEAADPGGDGADGVAAAGAEFQLAMAAAKEDASLRAVLNDVDRSVAHVLGVGWSSDAYLRASAASLQGEPFGGRISEEIAEEPVAKEAVGPSPRSEFSPPPNGGAETQQEVPQDGMNSRKGCCCALL